MPPDDVPEDIKNAIKHWSQWIDYWAVDWDYRDDTFHNQWQTYRTKKEPKILLKAFHEYEEPGNYTIVIKVIDILGQRHHQSCDGKRQMKPAQCTSKSYIKGDNIYGSG